MGPFRFSAGAFTQLKLLSLGYWAEAVANELTRLGIKDESSEAAINRRIE